jgi:hypothetical protein
MSARCARLRKGRRCKKGRSGGVVAHQNRRRPLVVWRRGDLWLRQPGGVVARVSERGRCGRGGGLYGGVGVDEGARDRTDLVRLIHGDLPGARRVRLNLLEGMTDGVHSSVAEERGAGNGSGKGVSGRGLVPVLGRSAALQPFNLFPFSFSFLFCFEFCLKTCK